MILYENEEVLAAAKPAGQPSIPGRGAIGRPLQQELERKLRQKIFVVHRLDRDASGLIVFAKTAGAHKRLCAQFEDRKAKKVYLAAVLGKVEKGGSVDGPLREFGSGRSAVSAQGKPSLTKYLPKKWGPKATLLQVEPKTGRRHQIRAHLYSLGHPILGDRMYGQDRPVGGAPRLMLHALSLTLDGLPVMTCPPPPDFEEGLKRFELF